jgi:hypothetical protein
MLAQRNPSQDLEGIGLGSLLSVAQRTRPEQILVRSAARRELWSGEPGEDLTAALLDERASRLASLLSLSRLPARASALIMAAPGAEQTIAVIGALRSGLTPVLLPLSLDSAALQAVFDEAGPSLAIGMTRCGDLSPARMLRDAASRSMNARLVCAFGPDHPDGSVPLAFVLRNGARQERGSLPRDPSSDIRVVGEDGAIQALAEIDIVAGAVDIARVLKPRPDLRIVSLMMGSGLASQSAGLYLAMLTGCEYMPLGVFSLSALWASLSDGRPVCLIAPASVENALRRAGVLDHEGLAAAIILGRGPEMPQLSARTRILDVREPEPGVIAVSERV